MTVVATFPPLYPVSLSVEGRPCLVVGGGPVAARKATGLVECGAVVAVVAPSMVPAFEELGRRSAGLPGSVVLERRPYRDGEAGRYRLVVTATGVPEVDHRVAEDAEAAGVWVNCADDAEHCTFQLPSIHRDGPVCIAVSTGGSSPALATWLRQRAGAAAGPNLGLLAALLDEARHRLQDAGKPTEGVDWQALLDGDLPRLVGEGRLDEARAMLGRATADETRGPAAAERRR